MKVILSRKGFDSSSGGYPNLILPNGKFLIFPIPDENSSIKYSEIKYNSKSYLKILEELGINKLKTGNKRVNLNIETCCHLDPDLERDSYPRKREWKGVLGQRGAAETHLKNLEIKIGDLFLFFSWFRKTILIDGKLKYDPKDPHGRHIIYDYLRIGEIISPNANKYNWLNYHPHILEFEKGKKDRIYIANNKEWKVFRYQKKLVLTKEGEKPSKWHLPSEFKNINISYHSPNSWKDKYFQSAYRGQEFVFEEDKLITSWVKNIVGKDFEKWNKKL